MENRFGSLTAGRKKEPVAERKNLYYNMYHNTTYFSCKYKLDRTISGEKRLITDLSAVLISAVRCFVRRRNAIPSGLDAARSGGSVRKFGTNGIKRNKIVLHADKTLQFLNTLEISLM